MQPTPEQTAGLAWMQGWRAHTKASGSKIYEAFVGPVNGVLTGTALSALGPEKAYVEYHRIGPNTAGVYGLDIYNTQQDMAWRFFPLVEIEPGRITFRSEDGAVTIVYSMAENGGVDARADTVADGRTTTQEWRFRIPAP